MNENDELWDLHHGTIFVCDYGDENKTCRCLFEALIT